MVPPRLWSLVYKPHWHPLTSSLHLPSTIVKPLRRQLNAILGAPSCRIFHRISIPSGKTNKKLWKITHVQSLCFCLPGGQPFLLGYPPPSSHIFAPQRRRAPRLRLLRGSTWIEVSINGGTPKWMVFVRENPMNIHENGWLRGTPIFRNPPNCYVYWWT